MTQLEGQRLLSAGLRARGTGRGALLAINYRASACTVSSLYRYDKRFLRDKQNNSCSLHLFAEV